jgi:hypothetical protein
LSRKRRAGTSLFAVKPIYKKRPTTTITVVEEPLVVDVVSQNQPTYNVITEVEEPHINNRVSVIKFAPKPIEVIDISDDDEPQPSTSTEIIDLPNNDPQPSISTDDKASDAIQRFANWILIEEREPTEVEKFKRIEKRASFKVDHNISNSTNLVEYQQQIDDSYEAAIKHFIAGYPDDYLYSAKLEHVKLNKSIYLRPERIGSFDKTRFLNKVFMVSQSNEEFLLDGLLNVEVVIYKKVSGSGRRTTKAPQSYSENDIRNKKSIVTVKNNGKNNYDWNKNLKILN